MKLGAPKMPAATAASTWAARRALFSGVVARAIRAAGGNLPRRDDVVTQISQAISFTGALGTFGFDQAGDTTQRVVSIFEARSADPAAAWDYVNSVDYSAALPY